MFYLQQYYKNCHSAPYTVILTTKVFFTTIFYYLFPALHIPRCKNTILHASSRSYQNPKHYVPIAANAPHLAPTTSPHRIPPSTTPFPSTFTLQHHYCPSAPSPSPLRPPDTPKLTNVHHALHPLMPSHPPNVLPVSVSFALSLYRPWRTF